ncbi:MAG TPA: hypothetical protein VFX05_10410, partial [Casimicrobiaceae bacterium]|nr:hypothetical protein [Casimicrobiaceae bacterium]
MRRSPSAGIGTSSAASTAGSETVRSARASAGSALPSAFEGAASAEIGPEQAFAAVLARLQTSAESIVPGADADADAGERPGRGDDA